MADANGTDPARPRLREREEAIDVYDFTFEVLNADNRRIRLLHAICRTK